MGPGAVVILVVLAGMSMFRSARFIEEGEMTGVGAEALLFVINVGLLVGGNHWAWVGWQAAALSKVAFWPTDAVADRVALMPRGYFTVVMLTTALLNGAVYALFQWLR